MPDGRVPSCFRSTSSVLPWRIGLLLCAFPIPALAYVDPGSGMLMIQGLLALIGAIVVFVRNPITAIKALIERFRRK